MPASLPAFLLITLAGTAGVALAQGDPLAEPFLADQQLDALYGDQVLVLDGVSVRRRAAHVRGIGDVNGDGFGDVAVLGVGASIVFGAADNPDSLDPSVPSARSVGIAGDMRHVAAVGDVNGDGLDDFALGNPVYGYPVGDSRGIAAIVPSRSTSA